MSAKSTEEEIPRCPACGHKLKHAKTPREIERLKKLKEVAQKPRTRESVISDRVKVYINALVPGETFTTDEIVEKCEASIHTVRNITKELLDDGIIRKEGSPRYGITWHKLFPKKSP